MWIRSTVSKLKRYNIALLSAHQDEGVRPNTKAGSGLGKLKTVLNQGHIYFVP